MASKHQARQRIILGLLVCCVSLAIFSLTSFQASAAGPFGGNENKRLSIYDGPILLDDTGDIRIGNVGRDLISSGRMYLRPNGSSRASFLEGISGQPNQRLVLTGGLSSKDTIEADWTGINGLNTSEGAVTAHFHGRPAGTLGAAVYGEVTDCSADRSCYAGYFSGGTSSGVYAENRAATGTPTVSVTNNDPNGVAGRFEGAFRVRTLQATGNVRGSCSWVDVVPNETQCANGTILAGVHNKNMAAPPSVPQIDKLYCCEL